MGHSSMGYLISQIPRKKLSGKEVWLIIIFANILDLDLFLPNIFGFPAGMHHYFPIHTPIVALIVWLAAYFWLKNKFSKTAWGLAGIALISHLVLDDLSYWLSLVGLEGKMRPQIFWLYPFDPRYEEEFGWIVNKRISEGLTTMDVLKIYLFTLPRLFYLEVMLFFGATAKYLGQKYKEKKAKNFLR